MSWRFDECNAKEWGVRRLGAGSYGDGMDEQELL